VWREMARSKWPKLEAEGPSGGRVFEEGAVSPLQPA